MQYFSFSQLIDRESLSETTKKAEAEEKERKARIAEKQKKVSIYFLLLSKNCLTLLKIQYNAILGEVKEASVEKVVLELDEKTGKELLSIDPKLAKKLKPHQASGIRFMWDACFESLERAKTTPGSGCILAHCMGLGKTLQVSKKYQQKFTQKNTGSSSLSIHSFVFYGKCDENIE